MNMHTIAQYNFWIMSCYRRGMSEFFRLFGNDGDLQSIFNCKIFNLMTALMNTDNISMFKFI